MHKESEAHESIDLAVRYVLIDYENVHPSTLNRLDPKLYAVLVFAGANQKKMPTTLVTAMQRLGPRSQFIQVCGNGRNALDFHIAYYLGRIAAAEPNTFFYVVSKDGGYNPLIKHLEGAKIAARRIDSLDAIVGKRPVVLRSSGSHAQAASDRLTKVIDDLKRRGNSKPSTIKALRATISACFQKQLTDRDVSTVVDQLVKRGTITMQGTKVTYQLSA